MMQQSPWEDLSGDPPPWSPRFFPATTFDRFEFGPGSRVSRLGRGTRVPERFRESLGFRQRFSQRRERVFFEFEPVEFDGLFVLEHLFLIAQTRIFGLDAMHAAFDFARFDRRHSRAFLKREEPVSGTHHPGLFGAQLVFRGPVGALRGFEKAFGLRCVEPQRFGSCFSGRELSARTLIVLP